jgi:hypothetical protein
MAVEFNISLNVKMGEDAMPALTYNSINRAEIILNMSYSKNNSKITFVRTIVGSGKYFKG